MKARQQQADFFFDERVHGNDFGLRWQSAAATPLFGRRQSYPKRRGASLPAAVQKRLVAAPPLCAFPRPLRLCVNL